MKLPGRNDPCHCGSGKKYKKCCFQKDEVKAKQGDLAQADQISKEDISSGCDSLPSDSTLELPEAPVKEDKNITKLWNKLDRMNYPKDTSIILTTIESFIRDYPQLAGESSVIDELYELEETLYFEKRHIEYITLLEKIEQWAPDFYAHEFGWFDWSRLRYAVANRHSGTIEPLLVNFKREPVKFVGNLNATIDILAWAGAENELEELTQATYKQLISSSEVWNSDFISSWIYLFIFTTTATLSLSVEDSLIKIEQQTRKMFDITEEQFDRELARRTIKLIREDVFEWDCPFGKGKKTVDFFFTMTLQVAKHIKNTAHYTFSQAHFIASQLLSFWMDYKTQKRPKQSIYCITTDRVEIFADSLESVNAVAFLQAIWYCADYLYKHKKIDTQTRIALQMFTLQLYNKKYKFSFDAYPANALISEFPTIS